MTLTGPGGVGKTRLALEVAGQAAGAWPDGVWLRRPGAARRPGTRPPGGRGRARRARGRRASPCSPRWPSALGRRRLLLVLDNCEHVVDGLRPARRGPAAGLPGVRVLATSREPLGVAGRDRLPRRRSLAVPAGGRRGAAAELRGVPGPRACSSSGRPRPRRRVRRRRRATPTPWPQVCRRLDGLPLAIELAAARLRRAAVPRSWPRGWSDRFRLLTGGRRTAPPRQQTLRATLDWSHDLLTGPERTLFARLAVFAGGCTLEAAEAVVRRRPGRARPAAAPRGQVARGGRAAPSPPRAARRPSGAPAAAGRRARRAGCPRGRGASATGCWRRCARTPASAWRRAARRRRSPRGTPTTTWRCEAGPPEELRRQVARGVASRCRPRARGSPASWTTCARRSAGAWSTARPSAPSRSPSARCGASGRWAGTTRRRAAG